MSLDDKINDKTAAALRRAAADAAREVDKSRVPPAAMAHARRYLPPAALAKAREIGVIDVPRIGMVEVHFEAQRLGGAAPTWTVVRLLLERRALGRGRPRNQP